MNMAKYICNIPQLFNSYKDWVSANPQVVGDVETTVKWVSYIIAGRITSSAAMSELMYSLSNLLVVFNDQIIEKSRNKINDTFKSKTYESTIKLFLTTLDCCEVFIEYSAKMVRNEKGRWAFIILVQLIKFLGRLILTFYYKNNFVQNPPLVALERGKLNGKSKATNVETGDSFDTNGSYTFKLKRSGRVVRKVEGAPPVYMRNWKPLDVENDVELPVYVRNENKNKMAEFLYICKPLVHLGSIATFGYFSWKSWGTALFVDLLSLRLYHKNRQSLTKEQRTELSRRCVSLLLYLMRSPFYDRYSKNKIESLVNSIANNIPYTKAICNPILAYIPHWQETYFYMWST